MSPTPETPFQREHRLISEHEAMLASLRETSNKSMVHEAIELHRLLVADLNALYDADGKPTVEEPVWRAAWVREIKAFRILARMQCTTVEEAQAKAAYFAEPAAGENYSNFDCLTLDAYVDEEHADGLEVGEEVLAFLRTLVLNASRTCACACTREEAA